MSATAEVNISCPHCRRQYTMKVDLERMQRLKTRATCGRCGKAFDVASRIVAAQQQQEQQQRQPPQPTATATAATPTDAKTKPAAPAVQLQGTLISPGIPSADLRDEMEELAREFAEAAARFTPVGIKRSAIGLGGAAGSLALDPAPSAKPATVEEPTNPGITPASVLAANVAATTATTATTATITTPATPAEPQSPSLSPSPSAPPAPSEDPPALEAPAALAPPTAAPPPSEPLNQFSLDAEPAGEEEFAAAVPTLSRANAAPRSWLDLSDPGLASLESPPSAGAHALEALLHESETIALPPPPSSAS